jgi:carboxymethylenebutenolidase
MGKMIKLKAKDGFELGAYRADPAGTPKGGLVVIQEIFGVNHHVKNLADQYAKEGFVCVAPALFDRAERDVDLGYDEDARKKGFGLRQKIDWPVILQDVQAAHDALKGTGKIGIIGYCFGGSVVWKACVDLSFDVGVSFYGGQVPEFKDLKAKCPVQFHFGELDQGIPLDKVELFKAAHPEAPVYIYKGAGHGFTCDERGSFHDEAAKVSKGRAIEFLNQHLSPPARRAA